MKKNLDAHQRVSSIMSRKFPIVRAASALPDLTKFMLEHGITCATVSDENDRLIGHVSMIDLVREHYLDGDSSPVRTVRDIMMPFVLRLPESASIDDAAALMAVESVHRVLIVSETNEAVGIVTALDVLRWMAEKDGLVTVRSRHGRERSSWEYAT